MGAQQLAGLLPMVLIIVVMYFLMIRPEKKRAKLAQQMRDGLIVGDIILTIGGVVGKIIKLKDDEIFIESGTPSDKSVICFKRTAVSEVLKPGKDDSYDQD